MMYDLPQSLVVCGVEYEIRSDYRAALDICAALSDCELNEQEKSLVALEILYVDFEHMPFEHYEDALKQGFWFLSCGEDEQSAGKSPKLMDWEQDFPYIVAPINRVLGTEIRALEYLHWWSLVSAYQEIGDCTFAQIVRIRDRKAKGKKLDKADQEWYRNNRKIVDFKQKFTENEKALLKEWGV